MSQELVNRAVEACNGCATACQHCILACLEEENVSHLKRCIQLDLECAALCRSAAEIMTLKSVHSGEICKICAVACHACAEECEKHAQMGMGHCRVCAEACRKCAQVCEEVARGMQN